MGTTAKPTARRSRKVVEVVETPEVAHPDQVQAAQLADVTEVNPHLTEETTA
jgi:hypothetical protein